MRKIGFDIETKNAFLDAGRRDLFALEVSLVGVYDSATDSYSSYLEEEFPKLWPILASADVLIGFNSNNFDIPILNRYFPGDLRKLHSRDLLEDIRSALGRRVSLDNVAEGTLGTKKSGSGLQAIRWWQEGEIEKLRSYCLDDVRITKELYDYALQNGKLAYARRGVSGVIPLDTSGWEKIEERPAAATLF